MLEEKLAKAREQSSRHRTFLITGFLLITVLCGLLLFGLSSFDFSATEKPAETTSKKPATTIDDEQAREAFKKILQQYKSELKPQLDAANLAQWNQTALNEINQLEQSALSYFSQGDYGHALDQIQSLHEKSTTTLADAQQVFKENMQKATEFFNADQYEQAKAHIDKALVVNAQSAEAQALQQDIEKLKQILPLLTEAKAARDENDLQKEYQALQQILDIAPKRPQEAERFKVLSQRIQSNQFEAQLAAGFRAIKKQQTQKARQHYQKAKKLNPKHKRLAVLLNQITEQEKNQRIHNALQQAQQGVQQDNWQHAKTGFEKVLKDAPKHQTALDGLKRAKDILSLQSRLASFTKDPYRLADNKIITAAEETLKKAQPLSSSSPKLKQQAQKLQTLTTAFNQLIPITITSDNKTYILIRGVGKVGTVSQKSLKLKPGRYTFEGRREGYKSKLLPVLIPYNKSSFSIRVVCDEPI